MSVIPIEETLKYVNEARTNPQSFARYIQQDIDTFIDDRQMPLLPNLYYSTNQGISAWKECLAFLKSASPLPPYKFSQALNLTASDHAKDMAKTGIQGHRGSDGSTLTQRLERRCGDFDGGAWAENIGSQFDIQGRNHALKTVTGLIIDDGVPSRGHRKNIFSKTYQFIGIHSVRQGDKIKTVMNFHSDDLQQGQDSDDDQNNNSPKNIVSPSINNNMGQQPGNWNPFNQINFSQNIGFSHNNWQPFNQNFSQGFNNQPNNVPYSPYQKNINQFNNQIPNNKPSKPKKSKKVQVGSQKRQQSFMQNGQWVTKTIQTIQFSDGSVQEHETIHYQ